MSNSTCEKCQAAPGDSHSFHYGRTASAADGPSTPLYRAAIRTSGPSSRQEYHVGGVDAAVLCTRCLTRARARRAATRMLQRWRGVPVAAALYAVWMLAVLVWAWQGGWAGAAILLAAGLIVTTVGYAATYLALADEDFAQHTAVDLHVEHLRTAGWDSFWTDKEFSSLTPH